MIQVSNIQMPLDWGISNDMEALKSKAASMLGVSKRDFATFDLYRRGVDARRKSNVHFVVTAIATLDPAREQELCESCKDVKPYAPPFDPIPSCVIQGSPRENAGRPVVVGSGPAGLFCALVLARAGLAPIVLERGGSVDERAEAISKMSTTGNLDPECNVQFGEGGAGTYSDGKLGTGLSGDYVRAVLNVFAEHGAPPEILWQAKPHIGTDKLPGVVRSIREDIVSHGGTFEFNTRFTKFLQEDGGIVAAEATTRDGRTIQLDASAIVLAIGHSSRDTYEMLAASSVPMAPKPFSIGVRIEHLQRSIDLAQYGKAASHPALGAADYKLSCHLKSGRSVYTFCMCPGGEVVAAASEPGRLAVNGMSRYARDGRNSNSALLVDVRPEDFGSADPLAGIEFQRTWEERAFELGGRSFKAPAQLLGDFVANRVSKNLGKVKPTYPLGIELTSLDECLPAFATESLREAIPLLGRKIRGFDVPDAVLTGVETRSSAPVRILRDKETRQSSVAGLFPCGEGAGYAGGITSSAVDGIKTAEAVAKYLGRQLPSHDKLESAKSDSATTQR